MLQTSWLQNSKMSVVRKVIISTRVSCIYMHAHQMCWSFTRVCAVEDGACMSVKLLPEDGALVHVACVDQALCCIFKQQIALSVLVGLKELEACVCCQCFLLGQKHLGLYSCCHLKAGKDFNMFFVHAAAYCTCDFRRKSYTRAVSTGRVMTVLGGTAPRLQLSQSDSGARRPSAHSSSKSDGAHPFAQPEEFRPEAQSRTYYQTITIIV